MNICIVKNIDSVLGTYLGKDLEPNEEYQIPDSIRINWATDDAVLGAISGTSPKLGISNGALYYTSSTERLSCLRNELPVNTDITTVDKTVTEKAMKVANTKLEGSSSILVSHNFCDKTTWYSYSSRITGETLELSTGFLFVSDHTFWIDLVHGKIPYEDRYAPTYNPKIYIDGVQVTTGFSINYVDGSVTFEADQTGKVITADYSYAVGSGWKVKPDTGKILKLIGTQVKFSTDITIASGQSIKFQPFALVNGAEVSVGSATIYKNIMDFVKCTLGDVKVVPMMGGMTCDIMVMHYEYVTSKELKSSQNTFIKIWVNNDEPISGTDGCMVAEVISIAE